MEGLGFFSIFIALLLAMFILPNLAPLIFKLIVGKSFFLL